MIAARNAERGAQVVREIEAMGGAATFVATDVSQADEVRILVQTTVQTYGRLDCAFNNAASSDGTFALTADFGEAEFDRTIAVNLKGVWLCSDAASYVTGHSLIVDGGWSAAMR